MASSQLLASQLRVHASHLRSSWRAQAGAPRPCARGHRHWNGARAVGARRPSSKRKRSCAQCRCALAEPLEAEAAAEPEREKAGGILEGEVARALGVSSFPQCYVLSTPA